MFTDKFFMEINLINFPCIEIILPNSKFPTSLYCLASFNKTSFANDLAKFCNYIALVTTLNN